MARDQPELATWTRLQPDHRCPSCGAAVGRGGAVGVVRDCGACGGRFVPGVLLKVDKGGDTHANELLLGPSFCAAYELETLVGFGGSGRVYRALERASGKTVAIKFHSGAADQPLERLRFAREGRLLAGLDHPALVRLHAVGELPHGVPFLVSEFVEGGTLRQRLSGPGARADVAITRPTDVEAQVARPAAPHAPLSIRAAVHTAIQILSGLAALHASGVLHRDLKPDNILMDPKVGPRITDLGLARPEANLDTVLTETGAIVGTPLYMSPEQVRGEGATIASDLYAVGVMLFEMVAGVPPFQASTAFAVMRMHVEEPPPSLSALRRGVPPALEALIARTLAKDPAERPPSADYLARELRALEGRLARRQRIGAAIACGIVLAATYLMVSGWPLPDPEVEALRHTLAGKALTKAGRYREARSQYRLALEIQRVRYGYDGLPPSQDLLEMGINEYEAGNWAACMVLCEGSLAIRRQRANVPAHLLADAMDNLAKGIASSGDPQRAEAMLRESLTIWLRAGEHSGYSPLGCLNYLAWLEMRRGDLRSALDHYKRARDIAIRHSGPDHSDVAALLCNIASTHKRLGDVAASLDLYSQALAVLARGGNRRTPVVAQVLANQAHSHLMMGAPKKAIPLLDESIDIFRSIDPGSHPLLGLSLANRGLCDLMRSRPAAATGFLRAALAIQERALTPLDAELLRTLDMLCGALLDTGSVGPAGAVAERLRAVPVDAPPRVATQVVPILTGLAHRFHRAGAPGQALPLGESALAIAERRWGPDDERTVGARGFVTRELADQGRAVDARRSGQVLLAHLPRSGRARDTAVAALHYTAWRLRALGGGAAPEPWLAELSAGLPATPEVR